jgi:predicted PurR-regulated permease PerM
MATESTPTQDLAAKLARTDAPEKEPATAPQPEAEVPQVPQATTEEAEVLQASIKAGTVAQIVMAAIAVLGLIYLLKVVLVTTLASVLLAFVLEPMVALLTRIRLPRSVGALIAVLLLLVLSLAVIDFFYSRAVDFATELPKYSSKIRAVLSDVRQQTNKIEESTRSVMAPPKGGRQPVPVEVQEAPGLSHVISAGSSWGESLLAITFVPFLVYFMLTWKAHAHNATVRLFPKEHRMAAYRTVARISEMIKSFILGNVLVGLVSSVISVAVFWWLHIPYFYFLGVLSGFISLIPYLGVFLALLPPIAGGIGVLNRSGLFIIIGTVVALHLITVNVMYPKIVGKRLRLNPLAITLALLFWAWIWGGMGLILAVPIVGATKIVCDYMEPLRGFGAWLGE